MQGERRPRFEVEARDDDVAELNARLAVARPLHDDLEVVRRDRRKGVRQLPDATERVIEGPAGPLTLRVFAPPRAERAILHLHDGAWATGSADIQDLLLAGLRDRCNAVVLSVEYRLAPEAPYPAASDDVEAAASWLSQNADSEFGVERVVIWGESAGAHLAVSGLLRLRNRDGLVPFEAAVLNYGMYDLTLTPSARSFGARQPLMSTPTIERFVDLFVAPGVDRTDPDVSPLYARLEGLPRALFMVGTFDPFVDDSTFMWSRWLCAGNDARLVLFPDCPHGFSFFPIKAARRAFARQVDFVLNES